MSTESIQHRLQIIKDINDEIKKIRALYTEKKEEDSLYVDMQEDAKKYREEIKIRKTKVMANPEFVEYEEQIKELKDDLNENKEILSQELADYYKESGNLEIVGADGNRKRIKFSVTLVNAAD